MNIDDALGIVRLLIDKGLDREEAINNLAIPVALRSEIKQILEKEENIILEPAKVLVAKDRDDDWLHKVDRSTWYYWTTLRNYLLGNRALSFPAVRSLDEATDRILGYFDPPHKEQINIRGLVIGYVQSGKTANFAALIAKAADIGFRLIIVLSGIDNGLRRQTQIRLNRELVGYVDGRAVGVPLPPMGRRWHQFTTEELSGDFQPGFANYAALQGNQPVLLVIKKNASVLRRLHDWIDLAPEDVRQKLPVLVIDDEADQASIDTRGSYIEEGEPIPDDYEPPSVINGRIRELLRKFRKRAYVAYTATPFANVLVPHDNYDPNVEADLYPKDFIVDLPKPDGYFGAEELFGRIDPNTGEESGGLEIINPIPQEELSAIENEEIPPSLELALMDFVLGGAARIVRGQGDSPSSMLLHGSQRIAKQRELRNLVSNRFSELRDEWRYQRSEGILPRLRQRWDQTFLPVSRTVNASIQTSFDELVPAIGQFFESIQIREINSDTGDMLDYEAEPNLKVIAIGGNRLARGITIEGLLVSYFFRPSTMYDTLMQMGRWFGFRSGYEDLTRIYMTHELETAFSHLARAEYELREDIKVYEALKVTPLELGTRILKHPTMLVTSRLKQRYSESIIIEQTYSAHLEQTIRFPFDRPDILQSLLSSNLEVTTSFVSSLGEPAFWEPFGPIWSNVTADLVLGFMSSYKIDPEALNLSMELMRAYIERKNELGELTNWTISVRGREKTDPILKEIDLGLEKTIAMASRTRKPSEKNSLGVITNPTDELIGLSADQLIDVRRLQAQFSGSKGLGIAARKTRGAKNGLLLLYPISRYSGHEKKRSSSGRAIYVNPDDPLSSDLIGLAISFPESSNDQPIIGEYAIGTVGWKPK